MQESLICSPGLLKSELFLSSYSSHESMRKSGNLPLHSEILRGERTEGRREGEEDITIDGCDMLTTAWYLLLYITIGPVNCTVKLLWFQVWKVNCIFNNCDCVFCVSAQERGGGWQRVREREREAERRRGKESGGSTPVNGHKIPSVVRKCLVLWRTQGENDSDFCDLPYIIYIYIYKTII